MRRIILLCILLLTLGGSAYAATQPRTLYLPLTQRSAAATAMPPPVLAPTPTPPPGPIRIVLPPELGEPEHVLSAGAAGCHPVTLNCYYFATIKLYPGRQIGAVLRWRPGAPVTELVASVDQPRDFSGPVALGAAALLNDGSIDAAFSACTVGAEYGTGCAAYRWRIMGVDAPFNGARTQGGGRAVEVVR